MRVSQRDHQNILDQADIVDIISRYVPLDKKGKEYVGVCPFHDDHSFHWINKFINVLPVVQG